MYNEGFRNFLSGNWQRARKQFRQVESVKRAPDTPTSILMKYMAETDYEPPKDWKGYRIGD